MSSRIEASHLLATITPARGSVVMMCGIAGSGKTTVATQLAANGFIRLSIDEEIWQRFGQYGVDYAPEVYPQYQAAARAALHTRLVELLVRHHPTVIDFSFWSRASRDAYKQLIVQHGCVWTLLYLQVPRALLRHRLAIRRHRFDANAAFPITDELLTQYLSSFEEPKDEGEMVVVPSPDR